MIDSKDKTLTSVLKELGMTHGPTKRAKLMLNGVHRVKQGRKVMFTGTAGQVWGWLRRTRRIK